MAALLGFDSYVAAAAVTPAYVAGQTLVSVVLPPKVTVGGIDLDVDDLDSNTSPAVLLDIGDVNNLPRFVSADTIAQDGGTLEYRPDSADYYRYNIGGTVLVTVNTLPATAVAGALGLTVYGYPSLEISVSARMVLQVLGVLAEGETPRAADNVLAIEALTEVHEQLRFKSLANRQDLAWPVTLLPAFAGRSYARMAANLLADTFGISAQRAQYVAQRAVEGEREMRRQTQVKSAGGPVSLEPYRDPPDYYLDLGVLG